MEKFREERRLREVQSSERRLQERKTTDKIQEAAKISAQSVKKDSKVEKSEGIWCTSQGLIGLAKYIKAEKAGVLHFSGHPSMPLRGETMAGLDEDTLFITFQDRPPEIGDEELCRLLFRKLCQHTGHESRVRAACNLISRRGSSAPPEFLCPITLAVMHDPVLAADGSTYERDAIAHWIERVPRSPLTNLPLASVALVPNNELHGTIGRWARQVLSSSTE